MNCAFWDGHGKSCGVMLKSALHEYDPIMLPFKRLADITRLARKMPLDVAVLPCNGTAQKALDLATHIKAIPCLSVTPVILWHPDPDAETSMRILNTSVDDLVVGDLKSDIAHARLRLAVRRSRRDLDVNPSSCLPGPTTIEKVVQSKLDNKEHFAVCYADLDDFKAYNDYYGYFYGDRVIKMTSGVIRETVFEFQGDGFVGHIGGDDFVFVVDATKAEKICKEVLSRFDARIGSCYDPRDRRNGYIISRNRRSVSETYPLMGLSIAVVINRGDTFTHVGEISHMVADLKKYAKTNPGSNYVIERRAKY